MTRSEAQHHVKETQDSAYQTAIPPLIQGDSLCREEFERRYNAVPHLKKAELIEGRVSMSSAVKRDHSKAHAEIIGWLFTYAAATPGVEVNDNGTVRLDEKNVVQPDVALRIVTEGKGFSQVSEDGYVQGSPELAIEISDSSASFDLGERLRMYQRCGVQEYLVRQIYENRLDWFELQDGSYVPIEPDAVGILQSRVFPGLHLAADALLAGDLSTVLGILQRGIQTKWHETFAQSLATEQ